METEITRDMIDPLKLSAAWAIVRPERPNWVKDDFEDFVFADWREGQEHMHWLHSSLTTANEIADWVLAESVDDAD